MENLVESNTEIFHNLTTRIKWGSVFGGVAIALVAGWLFNLLGLAIGLTTFATSNDPLPHAGMGSIIWLSLSSAISMFLGGWVAAQSTDTVRKSQAILHGILAWAMATIFSFLIVLIAAGAAVNTAGNMMGQGISLAAEGVSAVGRGAIEMAPQLAQDAFPDLNAIVEQIKEQANQASSRTSQSETQVTDDSTEAPSTQSLTSIKDQLGQAITTFLTGENEDAVASARKNLVNLLAQHTDVSQIQAEQQVNDWQEKYHQARQKMKQAIEEGKQKAIIVAKQTSQALAGIALITFFMLLIGGIAAATGGAIASRKGTRHGR